jgi:hypothetical protein
MVSKLTEIAIDCADPSGLARFWCAVLGYEVQDQQDGLVTAGCSASARGRPTWGRAT